MQYNVDFFGREKNFLVAKEGRENEGAHRMKKIKAWILVKEKGRKDIESRNAKVVEGITLLVGSVSESTPGM